MIDYEWRLRPLLAERGVYTASQLAPLLAEQGVRLSETQVWRLLTGKPERLNLHTLMVLCELLDCTPNDLIRRAEPVAAVVRERRSVAGAGVGDIVPKKARIGSSSRPGSSR
jgi:DNA-binding Xre family transcriptional regulator